MAPLIVGVAGCSCSGKTTVSRMIQNYFGKDRVQILHQDDFFLPQSQIPVNDDGIEDWDCLEALDVARFSAAIDEHVNSDNWEIIIIEGFLVFSSDTDDIRYDMRYLIHVDLPDLIERRRNRIYPVDGSDGFWQDPPQYVETIVYPNYLRYYERWLGGQTARQLNLMNSSEMSCDDLANEIIVDITRLRPQ